MRTTLMTPILFALAACGGGSDGNLTAKNDGGTMPEDLPDREVIYAVGTVAELEALGARRLTEDEFSSEVVGKRLRAAPGGGFVWKINEDGTSITRSAGEEWRVSDPGTRWTFENGQYCRPSCSAVYELDGVFRFTDSDDPESLSGWAVEEGGWEVGELLYDEETLRARHVAAARLDHQRGKTEIIDPVDFSMRRTEEGEYVVTLDGFQHTFTRDQRTEHGARGGNDDLDIEFSVFGWPRRNFNENLDAGHSRGEHVMYVNA